MWRHFRTDFLVYALSKVVVGLGAFAILRVLTHSMTPADYGTYALLYAMVSIVAIVGTSLLTASIVRFAPRAIQAGQARRFLATLPLISAPIVVACIALMALVAILSSTVGLVVLSPLRLLSTLSAIAAAAVFNVYSVTEYALRRRLRYAAVTSLQTVIFLGGTMVVSLAPFDAIAAALLSLAASYILPVLIFRLPAQPLRPTLMTQSVRHFRQFAAYGAPLVALNVAIQLNQYLDQFMLRAMRTLSEVGLYSAHFTFADKIVYALGSVVALAAVPLMFREWEANRKPASYQIVWRAMATFLLMALAMLAAMRWVGPWALNIVTPESYESGAKVVPYIMVGAVFTGMASMVSEVLTMHERTVDLALCYLLSIGVKIGLNLYLIPGLGIMGCAYATALASSALLLIVLVRVQTLTGFLAHFPDAFRPSEGESR